MSEYPWDLENRMLHQHEQPCDCAICDEIHFQRESRRQRRKGQLDPQKRIDQLQNDLHSIQLHANELEEINKGFASQIKELKDENEQLIQTGINFHEAWSELYDAITKIESVADEDWENGRQIAEIARGTLGKHQTQHHKCKRCNQLETTLEAGRKNVAYAQHKWAEAEERVEKWKAFYESAVESHVKYFSALKVIAQMEISGLSWQHDYEKCANIAREALEI